jgi:hypothetical protein
MSGILCEELQNPLEHETKQNHLCNYGTCNPILRRNSNSSQNVGFFITRVLDMEVEEYEVFDNRFEFLLF